MCVTQKSVTYAGNYVLSVSVPRSSPSTFNSCSSVSFAALLMYAQVWFLEGRRERQAEPGIS